MKLGNKVIFFLALIPTIFVFNVNLAEDKIISAPLFNIEKIKPSFDELIEENENLTSNQKLKQKKK